MRAWITALAAAVLLTGCGTVIAGTWSAGVENAKAQVRQVLGVR